MLLPVSAFTASVSCDVRRTSSLCAIPCTKVRTELVLNVRAMTPEAELAGSVATLEDFFSCGAGMALPSSPLSTISEDALKETASVALIEQMSSLLQQVQSVTAH